jgi:hypothetical protein
VRAGTPAGTRHHARLADDGIGPFVVLGSGWAAFEAAGATPAQAGARWPRSAGDRFAADVLLEELRHHPRPPGSLPDWWAGRVAG